MASIVTGKMSIHTACDEDESSPMTGRARSWPGMELGSPPTATSTANADTALAAQVANDRAPGPPEHHDQWQRAEGDPIGGQVGPKLIRGQEDQDDRLVRGDTPDEVEHVERADGADEAGGRDWWRIKAEPVEQDERSSL